MKTATSESGSAVEIRSTNYCPLTTLFITVFFIIKKQSKTK